jgi:2,4-dienoyl-CoA reductase-like NADH-dependent reductase (Old Yellow Enzyme family)
MDKADLHRIREAFVASAQRAVRLGFQAIELHGAHGYLLHEFLSPLSNQRTDEYGGSLANRMRFPLEIFRAVRDRVPTQIPVGMRISATDWVEGGWDLAQSIELGHALDQLGSSFIHVSSGGLSPQQKITLGQGYQIPFAHAMKQACKAPIIGVGLIDDPAHAESIIAQGEADMVALARGMLFNPRTGAHNQPNIKLFLAQSRWGNAKRRSRCLNCPKLKLHDAALSLTWWATP